MFDIKLHLKKTTSLPDINSTSINDFIKQNYKKYLSSSHSNTSTITSPSLSSSHHYNYSSSTRFSNSNIHTERNSNYSSSSNSNNDLNFNLFSEKLKRIKIRRLRAIKPLFEEENYKHVLDLITKRVPYNNPNHHEDEIKALFMDNPSLANKIYGKNYINKYDKLQLETKPEILNKEQSLFNKTKYSSSNSVNTFFNKYRQLSNLQRKHPNMHISPSLAFVKACKQEKIIPNAIGLIKRDNSDDKVNYNNITDNNTFNIDLSNCKAGNDCIKAISASIKILNEPLNALMLSSNRLNQNSMDVLFKAITMNNTNVLSKLQKLDLSYNSISTTGSEHLIALLSNPQCVIEYINLESNNLRDVNITSIATCISHSHIARKLKYINFNSNCISNESSNAIASMLEQCVNLQFLMLSKNNLNNKGGSIIISKLKLLRDLRVLDLSYNNIGNHLIKEPLFEDIIETDKDPLRQYHNFELNEIKSSMNYSFKSNPHSPTFNRRTSILLSNTTRKSTKKITLNLKSLTNSSRHSISKIRVPPHKVSSFAKELCDYFTNSSLSSLKCMLVHLDISHNHISYEDCEYIATYIKTNHSILGIHVDGNDMNIDALGFIHPNHTGDVNHNQHYGKNILSYSMNTSHAVMKSKIDAVRKIRNKNNCWICEGWKETEFVYIPTKDEELIANYIVVKLHLSFENYEPYDMIYNGKYFSRFRMCPPGYVEYFYTVDTKAVTDYGKETVTLNPKRNKINIVFTDEYFDELNNIKLRQAYSSNDINVHDCMNNTEYNKEITVTTIAKRKINENFNVIDDTYRTTLKFCEPRPTRQINRFVKPRTPWTFPISIWAKYDYNYDGINNDYLNKCFEHDFKRCQLEKEFITEKALYQVKDILRDNYKDIVDCYKNLASYSGFTTWQISQNVLVEWINKCQGLCDRKYDINGVFLVQTGICANALDKEERVKHNNKNLGDNIVRHQFMALIAKVPKDKYIRSKYRYYYCYIMIHTYRVENV